MANQLNNGSELNFPTGPFYFDPSSGQYIFLDGNGQVAVGQPTAAQLIAGNQRGPITGGPMSPGGGGGPTVPGGTIGGVGSGGPSFGGGTPGGTGTGGPSLGGRRVQVGTSGVGGVGTQGSDPNIGNLQCVLRNYHIGPLIEIVQSNNRLVGPDGNDINLSQYPDHKNLSGRQCILLAPLYECCWVRNPITLDEQFISNGAKQIGWVQLARSRAILSYQECEINGVIGKRPVILQYFPEEEIINGGFGTVDGPNNPTKFVSIPGVSGTALSGNVWGNCYGTYNTDFFVNWFNANLYTTYNFQNLQTYRTIGNYGLTDPSGGSLTDKRGVIVETGDCVITGNCVVTSAPPPPPPSVECISTTVVIPKTPQEWLNFARQHFGTIPFIGTQLRDSNGRISQIGKTTDERQIGLLNDGALVDLESYGSPCRIGQVARYQVISYTSYPEFTFCQLTNGTTRLVFTGRVIEDKLNPSFDGPVTERVLGVTQFNPLCCDRLKTAYLSNDSVTLNSLSNIGLRVQHIEMTKKYELLDSCSCEEVEIADLGCFFNNRNYSTILEADIKDLRTHTGVKRQVVDERCKSDGPNVYHPFDRRRDIILNRTKSGTNGLFDGDDNMDCYFTSSTKPTTSNSYYYEVTDCETCGKIPYFAVSYGHVLGSGSTVISNEESNKTSTDSIYSQYQLICLETGRNANGVSLPKFSFVSKSLQVESDDIYVINFNRNGIKDKLDPGNFQINLSYLSGNSYGNNFYTGSNVTVGGTSVIQLIDNSSDFDQSETCESEPLTSYSIVSGSLSDGKYEDASVNTYGTVYPHAGVIVLHPKRLNELLGFNTVTGSNINGNNAYKLFTSISGAAAPYSSRSQRYYLTARNVKYKTTSHFFVRAYAPFANYSNNPTYVTGSLNEVFDKCFIKDPTTYITSIGLYNSSKELLAVAKLSKPIKKNFETDLLIKIRLNW